MFLYELIPRLDKSKIILNMMYPGMVDTSMSDDLPIYLRISITLSRRFVLARLSREPG